MKPAAFDYYKPKTLSEVLDLLAQFGESAKLLAGGQSLVPMMNMRLARPAQLIDLNGLGELDYIKIDNGELRIGAMTRQRALERSPVVAEGWPLLRDATRYIGHVQIRNRGTVGGSLAHAYPAAELPVAMTALNATLILQSEQSERTVPAETFFVDAMATSLKTTELLVEIRVPQVAPHTGWSFQEISRRHGDFALMGVAGLLTLRSDGAIEGAQLVFCGPTPHRAANIEQQLLGHQPHSALFHDAAKRAVAKLEPESDIHASAAYRKEVAKVLARRALEQAAARAFTPS
ncbi:MAG TPA: xanthine dehydrogenase family protein subunit M [Candidatus Binatia bacterium]|nr:xanthine dehydrogenase family protein subunit M [Candidatus Binatia bacterium]